MSKGDVALSVTMTSVSTVLSPILTPLITYKLIGERIAFDPIGMFWSIVQIVIIPICLGLATGLAKAHFAAMPMAAVPGVIFSAWHNISGAILAWVFTNISNPKFDPEYNGE